MWFTALAALSIAIGGLASNISLPGYPLALKTPYLSSWLLSNGSNHVPSAQAIFWQGQPLTWQILARVNESTYCLFGCPSTTLQLAQQSSISFTSTRTYVELSAGGADICLNFFSPVSLTNYTRQSIPYSYLVVEVKKSPGQVSILTAIDDSWTGQAPSTQFAFFETQAGSVGFSLSGTNPITFSEINQQAGWGNTTLAASSSCGKVSYALGSAADLAAQFKAKGSLGCQTSGYRSGDLVAVSYAFDGGDYNTATFALGLEQEQAFNDFNTTLTGYYRASINSGPDVADFFFSDYDAACSEADALDATVVDMGQKVSQNYSDILESSVRQTFGSLQVLIPLHSLNTSQATAFTKEISTDGNVQTVADLVPRMFPAFYVLAPDYMRLMLKPLLDYTLQWTAPFMFHDLGKHYPNATGETVATQEALLVDQTSVIHWMAYAYVHATGDRDFVKPYLPALQKFANYLVSNGLYTATQRSSIDSIQGSPNQTVLATYSAIALTCFGALTGQQNYTNIGKQFADVVVSQGFSSDGSHMKAHFGDNDTTWITTYPFAFDKLLDLGTFNESTSAIESHWYQGQLDSYSMQFYSGVTYTVGDLMIWAGASSSTLVRDALIGGVHHFLTNHLNSAPGPSIWYVEGPQAGKFQGSIAKGIVGSYFMQAAINAKGS